MFKSLSENLGLGDLVESPETLEPSSLSSLTAANVNHLTTNSSPSLIGSSSPALNVVVVPLINSESEHPDVEDEEIMKKSKFKSYRDDIISVLKSFDNTREWADLIKCLQKMKKVLIKNSSLPILPEKITVSKRLAQCLNPALPSGVHLKTLETYEEIFKLITGKRLARDIHLYSSGLFTLFPSASSQIKPVILNLFEKYYLPLGKALVPCLPGLVLALLSSLEEEGSDIFKKTLKVMITLRVISDENVFFQSLWKGILLTPQFRVSSLNHIIYCLKKNEEPLSYKTPIFGGCLELVIEAMVASLRDNNIMAQRSCLEILSSFLTLDKRSNDNSEGYIFDDKSFIVLCSNALILTLKGEVSVNRRIFSWLFGSSDTDIEFISKHSISIISSSLKQLITEKCYNISIAKVIEIANIIFERIGDHSSLKRFIMENIITDMIHLLSGDHIDNSSKESISSFISNAESMPLLWASLQQAVQECFENQENEINNYNIVLGTVAFMCNQRSERPVISEISKLFLIFVDSLTVKVNNKIYQNIISIERNINICKYLLEQITGEPDDFATILFQKTETLFKAVTSNYFTDQVLSSIERSSIFLYRTLFRNTCDFLTKAIGRRHAHLDQFEEFSYSINSVDMIPTFMQTLFSCCFSQDPYISVFSMNTLLGFLSNQASGLNRFKQRYIVKESNYLKAITTRLWDMLTPSYSYLHFEVTRLIVELYNLNRHVCNAVVSDAMSNSIVDKKLEGNRRFALIWRLMDDLDIKNRIFEDGFYLMLDSISSDQSSLKLVAQSWLLSSFAHINRLLDPLLLTLIDKESLKQLSKHTRVKSSDSSVSDTSTDSNAERIQTLATRERKTLFDESRCKYVLSLLRNIMNVSPEIFIEQTLKLKASDEVLTVYEKFILGKPYYMNEESLPSCKLKFDGRDYFSILAVLCVKLMECGIVVNSDLLPMNNNIVSNESSLDECIRTSAAAFIKNILLNGQAFAKTTGLCIALCECILSHLQIAIDNSDVVFQVELLGMIQIIMEHLDSHTVKSSAVTPSQQSGAISQSASEESSPIYSLINSPTFLKTIIQGLVSSSRTEAVSTFHSFSLLSYWIDSIILFLPYLHFTLPKLVAFIAPSFCQIITDNALQGIDSIRSQVINSLLTGLRKMLEYCVLREAPKLTTHNDENTSGIVIPFKLFTDFVKDVFTQDDQISIITSPDFEARKNMMAALPSIIEAMIIVWKSLRALVIGTPENNISSLNEKLKHVNLSGVPEFGTLHSRFDIERNILRFIDPLILQFPNQLVVSILMVWSKIHENASSSMYCIETSLDIHLMDILNSCDSAVPDSIISSICDFILNSTSMNQQEDEKKTSNRVLSFHFLIYYMKKCIMSENHLQIAQKLAVLTNNISSEKNIDLLTLTVLLRVVYQFLTRWGANIQNDKKIKSSMRDSTQKLIEICFTACTKDILDRRNDLVKDLKRISSSNNLQDHSKEGILRKSIHDRNDPTKNFLKLLCNVLNDIMTHLYGEKDLGQPLIISILYPLFVIINNREITNLKRVKQAVKLISTFGSSILNMRPLKKEIWEAIQDINFFYCPSSTFKHWLKIFSNMETTDTSLVQDLLNKFSSTSSLLTSSSTEAYARARLMKRIAFMLFVGRNNDYNHFIPSIVEKIVESLKVNGSVHSNNTLLSSVLLFYRVLIIRITSDNLRKWWPMIMTDIMKIFSERTVDDEDSSVLIEGLKFLDLATVKLPQEFQLYKWIFIRDTTDCGKQPLSILFSPYLDPFVDPTCDVSVTLNTAQKEVRVPVSTSFLRSDIASTRIFASILSSESRQQQLYSATSFNALECDDETINFGIQEDLVELSNEDKSRLKNEPTPSINAEENWIMIDTLNN
ncbi:hypothetical protein C9374_007374 [Naegleria lovaniensis]|uniref:Dopey N-terminal domain-containing protein n=1 Tax=Naegleria lovaniensis TaxID=51637 RepID=A0AA88GM02_NAELO|nr:uncharacterized protein C9374_007374 [Naegleria lovaniensis]KAG2379235.1 hypothetical protein C9374_007374 [Naegleria lovaniensis]